MATKPIPKWTLVILVIAALAWFIWTNRIEVLGLTLLFVSSLIIPKLRRNLWATVAFVALTILVPFSPYGLTLRSLPGSPRFVGCCCCIPNEYERAKAA